MATKAAVIDPQAKQQRTDRLTRQSSLREKVFENLLLGQLGIELLEREIDFAVLHSMSDRDGYDVVIESGPITRHVQLKTTITGTTTREVPVNTRLAARPSGCVVWMVFDPAKRALVEFRWFGDKPRAPLPDLGDRAVRHSRANRVGIKAIRPEMRALALNRFERLATISDLADRLLGPGEVDCPARRDEGLALPCPDQRAWLDLDLSLTVDEAARVRQGLVPRSSDDRWFVFVENGKLYCHRSWTGACIFGASLEACPGGARLTRCWVSRDAGDYASDGVDADRELFRGVVSGLLLDREP